jgi:hypothetical protein
LQQPPPQCFRASDEVGLFALAKDLARLTVDSIDAAIQKIVFPPKAEKWGSLKSLEKLLAGKIDPTVACSMLGPLAGIYELRHTDAHLAGRDLYEAFALTKLDRTQPFLFQGYSLLHSCVSSLFAVWEVFENADLLTVNVQKRRRHRIAILPGLIDQGRSHFLVPLLAKPPCFVFFKCEISAGIVSAVQELLAKQLRK